MKKTPHISEFTAKKGKGLHVRVTTTRDGERISVDGGRLYFDQFVSKQDCMREAIRIRDEILLNLGTKPIAQLFTLEDVYQKSFDYIPVTVNTRLNYDYVYNHSLTHLSHVPLVRISLSDIQLSVNRYAETHSAPMVTRLMHLWRRIYRSALFLNVNVRNLPDMVIAPKSRVPVKRKRTQTDYETMLRFIDVVQDSNSYYSPVIIGIIWVMYYTGMRTTEVLGLSVDDIDLDRRIIHVDKASGSTTTEWAEIVPLKTDKSIRDIPIAPGLVPVLEKLIANAKNEYLFTDPNGKLLSSSNITSKVARYAVINQIDFSLYRLRHLFSADLFKQGTNPKVIQSLMGHASENMSLYYAFTSDEDMENAVQNRKPS